MVNVKLGNEVWKVNSVPRSYHVDQFTFHKDESRGCAMNLPDHEGRSKMVSWCPTVTKGSGLAAVPTTTIKKSSIDK